MIHHLVWNLNYDCNHNLEKEDLIQVAYLAAVEATLNYDESKGATLRTYLQIRCRGAILDEFRRLDDLERNSRRLVTKVAKRKKELEQKRSETMALEEVYEDLKLTEKQIQICDFYTNFDIYPFSLIGEEGDDHILSCLLVDHRELPDEIIIKKDLLDKVLQSCRTEKEKAIIHLYFKEDLSMRTIGKRFRVNESRISQIIAKIIKRAKKKLAS